MQRTLTLRYLCLSSIGLALVWSTCLRAEEGWPLFRGNKLSTGVASSSLPDTLQILWDFKVKDGAFEATPAIVDGICYIADLDGTIYALSLADGEVLWSKKTGSFGFAASPAIHNGLLYIGDIDGIFYCYDLQGNERWKFEAGAEISSSANFYQDAVLFGSQDATLYCLDAKTGNQVWKVEIADQIRCSPTVVQDRSFVAGCDGRLHIIDLKLGKETAFVEINAPTGVTPAASGDQIFLGTEAGEIFCIDWRKAEVVWKFVDPRGREVRSSPAVNDKLLAIGSRSKNVYGLDPKTGKRLWTLSCKRRIDSSPVIAGERVFVASSDGVLHLVDLLTGKELWKKETGGGFTGSPAIVDGKVIIASDDGVVYCLGNQAEEN